MTIDVPPTGPPRPLRWTWRLFHAASDFGLFENRRAMLIAGAVHEQGPEQPPHCCSRGLTADVSYRTFPGCHPWQRSPMPVADDTDPVPDVAVYRGSIREHAAHPTTPVLVVEVADSSLALDTTTKAELYATAGVPDYWVIDPDGRRLLVFRDPAPLPAGFGATAYRTHLTLGPADTVAPLAAPGATVRVAALLP